MERNWLIRTTQNQILGPVAKAKLLEFLQKGALGLNDEVSSGNGYWFSLKEKDLVEKYLHGDIPQGYNPISESKSVLSKRDNPERTTSINTSPANKTQVLKMETSAPVVLPANSDLEYPDITVIKTVSLEAVAPVEEMKLPNPDDLEFPDMAMITESLNSRNDPALIHNYDNEQAAHKIETKHGPVEKALPEVVSSEPVVYPEDDDLAYPDMGTLENSEIAIDAVEALAIEEVAVVGQEKEKEKEKEAEEVDLGLTLIMKPSEKKKVEKSESVKKALNRDKLVDAIILPEEKKLLHERKVKTSVLQPPKEVTKDLPKELPNRSMPDHLKKRNDNYLMYILIILVLIILALFFYYYRNILNKPLPV